MFLKSGAITRSDTNSTGDLLKTTDMDTNRPQVRAAGKANAIDPNPGSSDSREHEAMDHLDAEFMSSISFGSLIVGIYDDHLKPLARRVGRLFTRGTRR